VKKTYAIFKEHYRNAFREVVITDIINGESIEIKPDNILIHKEQKFKDEKFEAKASLCNKKLYGYQRNSIYKLRELELAGYVMHGNKKVISNGYLLSLPVGSGKSLVFQFLALFYRNVPKHPIIVSLDGRNIPQHDQLQWKYYPYFYENCGYIDGEANAVQVLENYVQREITIILTHEHLLDQMKEYFRTDFSSKILSITNIQFALYAIEIDLKTANIAVIPANQQNVDDLVKLSYDSPFMRIIIDDYTSMVGIDCFRQILSSSTIFVSGSGFNRQEDQIPASYYTLKFMPVNKISLVGKPEETFEGVFRDNIATMEILGNNCEFNQYEFVAKCEEYCAIKFREMPSSVYPSLIKEPRIHNYMALMFILLNLERIKTGINRLENDLKSGKINREQVEYYLSFKEMLCTAPTRQSAVKSSTLTSDLSKGVQSSTHAPAYAVQSSTLTSDLSKGSQSSNSLYNFLFDGNAVNGTSTSTIVLQRCMNCDSDNNKHNGFGAVSCCCGAFYCSECLDSMCSHVIIDSETNTQVRDKDYYCCVCRAKNSKYFVNCTKMRDKNIYAFALIEEYFEDYSVLKNHLKVDYYFYMFLNGLVPKTKRGKPLNIHTDILQGSISLESLKQGKIPVMDSLLPKDQLAINTIQNINITLSRLNIMPKKNSIILFYQCPIYMQSRVISQFRKIAKANPIETQIKETKQQPISHMDIMFKDSVASLIGMHKNIIAIVLWRKCDTQDNAQQMLGRCMRLNAFNTPLYFYITATNNDFN
jgi:hypothetical protein